MADAPSKTITISASNTLSSGRFMMNVRQNHFIADASVARGGKNEAPVAIELFAVSLATCALAVIVDSGEKSGFKGATYDLIVSATSDESDGTRFSLVDFAFRFSGFDRQAGERLVKEFTDICPIYNTVARTTPVRISISIA